MKKNPSLRSVPPERYTKLSRAFLSDPSIRSKKRRKRPLRGGGGNGCLAYLLLPFFVEFLFREKRGSRQESADFSAKKKMEKKRRNEIWAHNSFSLLPPPLSEAEKRKRHIWVGQATTISPSFSKAHTMGKKERTFAFRGGEREVRMCGCRRQTHTCSQTKKTSFF